MIWDITRLFKRHAAPIPQRVAVVAGKPVSDIRLIELAATATESRWIKKTDYSDLIELSNILEYFLDDDLGLDLRHQTGAQECAEILMDRLQSVYPKIDSLADYCAQNWASVERALRKDVGKTYKEFRGSPDLARIHEDEVEQFITFGPAVIAERIHNVAKKLRAIDISAEYNLDMPATTMVVGNVRVLTTDPALVPPVLRQPEKAQTKALRAVAGSASSILTDMNNQGLLPDAPVQLSPRVKAMIQTLLDVSDALANSVYDDAGMPRPDRTLRAGASAGQLALGSSVPGPGVQLLNDLEIFDLVVKAYIDFKHSQQEVSYMTEFMAVRSLFETFRLAGDRMNLPEVQRLALKVTQDNVNLMKERAGKIELLARFCEENWPAVITTLHIGLKKSANQFPNQPEINRKTDEIDFLNAMGPQFIAQRLREIVERLKEYGNSVPTPDRITGQDQLPGLQGPA